MTKPLSLNVFGLEGKGNMHLCHYDCFCTCVYVLYFLTVN